MAEYRAVAFLDILGFKDLISKNSADKVAKKYIRVIDSIKAFNKDLLPDSQEPSLFSSQAKDKKWCITKIFSDSVILTAHDDKEESCLRLLIYVWRL
jgi:hypothetical protein